MTLDNNPLEAGLNFFVKMKKETDFIGKESLLERKKLGFMPRKLVFMEVDTDNVDPEGNETIWHDDKVSHPEHVASIVLDTWQVQRPIHLKRKWQRKRSKRTMKKIKG